MELSTSGRPDLKRGTHRPERCALPGCATPRERRLSQSGGWGAERGVERYFGWGSGSNQVKMARRLIPVLALMLLAMAPATARAYMPPGFIGISPQNPGTA